MTASLQITEGEISFLFLHKRRVLVSLSISSTTFCDPPQCAGVFSPSTFKCSAACHNLCNASHSSYSLIRLHANAPSVYGEGGSSNVKILPCPWLGAGGTKEVGAAAFDYISIMSFSC